ncbi:MAG: ribulose-phosphate 3-epimerase [Candidatus Hodarchaeota archaeon]
MKEVAVSLHARAGFDLKLVEGLDNIDYFHVDVMDGKFVASQNLNLKVINLIKDNFKIPILVHLMVQNPIEYIEKIVAFVDGIFFHYEINNDKIPIINILKKNKKRIGLAVNPQTKISEILGLISLIDLILILGVNPGYSGQKFLPETINRVNHLAEFKKKFNFKIDVDGGVNLKNAKKLCNADILTSASTILRAPNPNKVIQKLKQIK